MNVDKNEDDKEKKDGEVEDEKEKEEKLKEGVDQNSAKTTTTETVDVKESPVKAENQNTPESTKNKPKGQQRSINLELIKFI